MSADWTHASQAFNATILADTNRDGQINDLDIDAKRTWTNERGALFKERRVSLVGCGPALLPTGRLAQQVIVKNTGTAMFYVSYSHETKNRWLKEKTCYNFLIMQIHKYINSTKFGQIKLGILHI